MKKLLSQLLRIAAFGVVLVTATASVVNAQNCGTGGGGNQTKFHSSTGPATVATPFLTATDYGAAESQLTSTLTLRGCCGNAGGGSTCQASISLGSVGAPNLANVSWRVTSVSGPRCIAASPAVPLNTDFALSATAKEVFRMNNPANNGTFCTVTIQFRGTGLSYTGHLTGNTYSRGANFSIVKS